MPKIVETKIMNFSAKEIYDLVIDVENYSEFLPWCKQAKIIEEISKQNLHADLLINFKSFFEKYRSNVSHGKSGLNAYFVDVVAIEGPFKKLVNQWQFRDLENGECEVKFFIEFDNSFCCIIKINFAHVLALHCCQIVVVVHSFNWRNDVTTTASNSRFHGCILSSSVKVVIATNDNLSIPKQSADNTRHAFKVAAIHCTGNK